MDLCRLAGLKECGLCCEIMREDGTMMRSAELSELAKRLNMKFITIRDLQNYRKCHEKLVDMAASVKMPTKYGDFMACGFVNRHALYSQLPQNLGSDKIFPLISLKTQCQVVLCRVHSECLTGDTFGSLRCDCGQQLAGRCPIRFALVFR